MEDASSNRTDGQDGRSESVGECQATTYRTYRRRFAMALAVMLLNMCNAGVSYNLASVSYKAADYFEATLPQINWFAEVCLILPLVFSLVSTFTYNKFGIKTAIHIGSALNCVGAVTRAVATSGLIPAASTQYAVSMTGQVAVAVATSFLLFISTKVAQNWFPDDERMLATSVLASAPPFGTSMGQLVSPLLVPEPQQLPTLNYVYAGLAVFCELVALVCVTRARPPTPPSRSAEKGRGQQAPYLQQLRDTVTCLPYLGLLLAITTVLGVFLCFTTLTQQMLCSVGYSELFSGATVTAFLVTGMVGSVALALLATRTKNLTMVVKVANALGVVFGIVMMEMYLVPDQQAILMVTAILFGIFSHGVFPLTLEIGVEATYPVEETISTSLIYVSGQVFGAVMTNIIVSFAGDLPDALDSVEVCTDGLTSDLQAMDYSAPLTGVMAVLSLATVLFVLFFHTPYKRQQVEEHAAATIAVTSKL